LEGGAIPKKRGNQEGNKPSREETSVGPPKGHRILDESGEEDHHLLKVSPSLVRKRSLRPIKKRKGFPGGKGKREWYLHLNEEVCQSVQERGTLF